jgi:hypothetical protein
MGWCDMGLVALRLVLGRQLSVVMALAGAAEDQQSGRQHEAGSAKKKSHNASDSKRPRLEGARTKARGKRETSNACCGKLSNSARRFAKEGRLPNRSLFLGMKLKGLSLALL